MRHRVKREAGKRKLGVEQLGRARKRMGKLFEDEDENEDEGMCERVAVGAGSIEERKERLFRNRVE